MGGILDEEDGSRSRAERLIGKGALKAISVGLRSARVNSRGLLCFRGSELRVQEDCIPIFFEGILLKL